MMLLLLLLATSFLTLLYICHFNFLTSLFALSGCIPSFALNTVVLLIVHEHPGIHSAAAAVIWQGGGFPTCLGRLSVLFEDGELASNANLGGSCLWFCFSKSLREWPPCSFAVFSNHSLCFSILNRNGDGWLRCAKRVAYELVPGKKT